MEHVRPIEAERPLPVMKVDSQTYEMRADGVLLTWSRLGCCRSRTDIFCFNVIGIGINCGLRTRVGGK